LLSYLLPHGFAQITVKFGFVKNEEKGEEKSNGEEEEDLLKSDLLNSLAELYLSGGLSGGLGCCCRCGCGCIASALGSGWLALQSGGWLILAKQGFLEAQGSRRLQAASSAVECLAVSATLRVTAKPAL